MRLHRNVRIQMIESTVGFFTAVPATFIHALNFLVPPARSLVLLCARNRHKRIHGRQRMSSLCAMLARSRVYAHGHPVARKPILPEPKTRRLSRAKRVKCRHNHEDPYILYLPLVASEQETPLQVQTDLTSQGDRTAAYPGEDNAQPNQVVAAAAGIWAFAGAPDSAAYRGVVCRASIAVGGEDRSGSSQRLLMDL